jgi:hypothetical protein
MKNSLKRKIPFSNKQDIARKSNGRPLILFGAGNIAEKTKRILTSKNIIAILDNSSNVWGEKQLGVEVKQPDFLNTNEGKSAFVIITTTSFSDVSLQLEQYGLEPQNDYIVSPILNDLRVIDELESIETKLFFSSGSPKQDNPQYGGGIYELTVDGDEWYHKKKISGNCYGITKFNDNYVALDTDRGIIEFDEQFKIVRQSELPKGSRAHGIDYSTERENFFIVCSYSDSVLTLDKDFKILNQISISNKHKKFGKPFHHCNDCCVWEDSLFVSMFSQTGNWKLDIFDGAILEFDIMTQELVGAVISDLWMPHNIKIIEGSLTCLDSLVGHLRSNNAKVVGEFPAFTRGLDHDGTYYYIGQSRNRNYSKNLGVSKNISIDAGVIIFDEYTKVSRFLQLPPKISEIHSILIPNQ